MADVFISYSKQDRALAETLAAQLKADGRTVWWDTDLVSGDQFRQVILDNLNAAKQVVVIWTPNSVKSEWVISEATRAAAQKKLVPVKIAALAIEDIPPPFDAYHTESISALNTQDQKWSHGTGSWAGVFRRIGIVLSVTWLVGSGGYEWVSATNDAYNSSVSDLVSCGRAYDDEVYVDPNMGSDAEQNQKKQKIPEAKARKATCEATADEATKQRMLDLRRNAYILIIFDFAVLAFAWIIIWIFGSLVKWVARGFQNNL